MYAMSRHLPGRRSPGHRDRGDQSWSPPERLAGQAIAVPRQQTDRKATGPGIENDLDTRVLPAGDIPEFASRLNRRP